MDYIEENEKWIASGLKKLFNRMIVKGNSHSAHKKAVKSFTKAFPNAVNVEWTTNDYSISEAIFHEDGCERIACFDDTGKLIEVRSNIQLKDLQKNIVEATSKYGEIMNAIEIKTGDKTLFECIVRDSNLVRYLLMFDSINCKLLKHKAL